LLDAQSFRRGRDVAFFSNGNEVSKVSQVHCHTS
jgi:hypothetical protein